MQHCEPKRYRRLSKNYLLSFPSTRNNNKNPRKDRWPKTIIRETKKKREDLRKAKRQTAHMNKKKEKRERSSPSPSTIYLSWHFATKQ
jgi:hypothetical protein